MGILSGLFKEKQGGILVRFFFTTTLITQVVLVQET